MSYALALKFMHNPVLKQKLLDTGLLVLHERDGRRPSYWTKRGDDRLGKLLMEVRAKCFVDGLNMGTDSLQGYLDQQATILEPLLSQIVIKDNNNTTTPQRVESLLVVPGKK